MSVTVGGWGDGRFDCFEGSSSGFETTGSRRMDGSGRRSVSGDQEEEDQRRTTRTRKRFIDGTCTVRT